MNLARTNKILSALDDDCLRRTLDASKKIELVQGTTLTEATTRLDPIIFPVSGVVSVLAAYEDGDLIEVATVGREGYAGITAVLGGRISPGTHTVQMPGHAYALSRDAFDELIAKKGAFLDIARRYADVFVYQIMISAACNGAHSVGQRLARWLSMMIDRSDTNIVRLTHEFLASILNVRRATVTDTLRRFESDGCLAVARGRIEVLDRAKLARASCQCYGMQADYRRRVIGPED